MLDAVNPWLSMISRSIARARTTRIFSVVIGSCRMRADLLVGQLLGVLQHQHLAVLGRQRQQRRLELGAVLVAERVRLGRRRIVRERRLAAADLALQRLLGAPLRLQDVLRTVDRDAQQPGRERVVPALAVKAIQRVERVDERLLRDVLGVGAAAQHPQRDRERQPLVSLDERTERLDVAVETARDQRFLFLIAPRRLRISAISGDASSDAEMAPLSSADRAMMPELEAPDGSTGRTNPRLP